LLGTQPSIPWHLSVLEKAVQAMMLSVVDDELAG